MAAISVHRTYGVILADPPWRFAVHDRMLGLNCAPDNHYPTMELEAIKAVRPPAANDAVLFLWATIPMLPEALEAMAAWDFKYVSSFSWVKDRVGTGYWIRARHEYLLVGKRGKVPAPAAGEQFESVIEAPRGAHSVKPAIVYDMIKTMFPSLPALEMFARGKARPGFDVWGNEAIP